MRLSRTFAMGLLVALLVVGLEAPPAARAGAPTDYLRSRIDKLYDLVGGVGLTQAVPERQAAARAVLDEMFDWPEMAKRSLGKYWGERTEAERAEFMRLFSELFQRTYLSRIHLADRERFEYLGDSVDGDRAVVRTRVFTKQGRQFPVAYQTRPASGEQWKIYDLDVDGISLVGNYRNQFTTLIGRSSYADLIEKLRAMVGSARARHGRTGWCWSPRATSPRVSVRATRPRRTLLDGVDGVVVTLGDHAYEAGTPIEFAACYDPSWGRHRARTRPAPGNHDYLTPGASGYFEYFGSAAGDPRRGYYSYDLGAWRVIALNSNCDRDRWLRRRAHPRSAGSEPELAANHSRRCTLAYWHHPRFSSGPHGSDPTYEAFWQALYERDADVVLVAGTTTPTSGSPRSALTGRPIEAGESASSWSAPGVASHHGFTGPAIANSEARNDDTFGVLKLNLYPASYELAVHPGRPAGHFTDSGTAECH